MTCTEKKEKRNRPTRTKPEVSKTRIDTKILSPSPFSLYNVRCSKLHYEPLKPIPPVQVAPSWCISFLIRPRKGRKITQCWDRIKRSLFDGIDFRRLERFLLHVWIVNPGRPGNFLYVRIYAFNNATPQTEPPNGPNKPNRAFIFSFFIRPAPPESRLFYARD